MSPLFPFLEANQGFLSLAALLVAFAFALWEAHRANDASNDRAREAVELAISSLNICLASLEDALTLARTTPHGERAMTAGSRADHALKRAGRALKVILQSTPPSASLLVALTDAEDYLSHTEVNRMLFSAEAVSAISERSTKILHHRDAILLCRPSSISVFFARAKPGRPRR